MSILFIATPLMYAVQKMTPLKALIAKGADVNIQNKTGETALIHTAGGVNALGNKYGTYTEILGYLLEKGANIDTEDKEGFTNGEKYIKAAK